MPKVSKNPPMDGDRKLGLVCRACGCQHFTVVYLRRPAPGVIVRRRECRNCSRRMTTREAER